MRIEFPTLQNRVEYSEIRRGGGACTRCPLPTAVIRGDVAIQQIFHNPGFAPTPIDQQIFHEIGCYNQARPVVYPADLFQLAHRRVYDGNTRSAFLPCLELSLTVPPWDTCECRIE